MKAADQHRSELTRHLERELLPFWLNRCIDGTNGGFLTHFDCDGNDTGEDEKSLIAQTRSVFSFSLAARHGWQGERCLEAARHGVRFLTEHMWDEANEGFFWTVTRRGEPAERRKVLYGHSFAVYALSEYYRATGDTEALSYARRVFELIQTHAVDLHLGGYFEMFEPDWRLSGPGSAGGDRKTLDVHMHLMEAYTNLYRADPGDAQRRKLQEIIEILSQRMFRQDTGTGVPQFTREWQETAQIKFDIVWGWDRFSESGTKANPMDNTSYGHNVEFAWLLLEALDALGADPHGYDALIEKTYAHALRYGIDYDHGGVYVEGSHTGPATDLEKEFWQQAEVMNGMLAAYLHWGDERYYDAYENVHDFVMRHMIHRGSGEWWPLLRPEGTPIWTHMSHSWKVNYHTIRAVIRCIEWLDVIRGSKTTASLLH
ncbi:MAG: AGE family epimerase/isomerase [Spirochaetaceae bacterium]